MTPIAHWLATFLLIKIVELLFKFNLSVNEELFIVFFANIMDLDYFIGRLFARKGESHHAFFTHTLPGVFVIWGILIAILNLTGIAITPMISALLFVSMLLHLLLDDSQYWFYRLGLQGFHFPQINWLYPVKNHHPKDINTGDLNKMINRMSFNIISEVAIITVASIYFIEKLV
jgi:hypothetical protein